jgi:phosphoenolpyruvate carboxylase
MPNANTYNFEIGLKYQIYNSIFLTLHFATIKQTGIQLPVFCEYIKKELAQGLDPKTIIQNYFDQHQSHFSASERQTLLFRFIQYVERQVVLIDALEEASFNQLNDLKGNGSLDHLIDRAKLDGKTEDLQAALQDFRVKIVLTAHPTQFYPGEVLGIINDLSEAFRESELRDIRDLLEQLGQTPFFKKEKPTPYDEAISLGWYLENIFYHALPKIVAKTKAFIDNDSFQNFQLLEVGFWPGGDRDGNPFVTSQITERVAKRLKFLLLKAYYKDVRLLKRRLTFKETASKLEALEESLRSALFESGTSFDFDMIAFATTLEEIKLTIVLQYNSFFVEKVEELLLKIKIFGSHFASLDIRQDSNVLQSAFDACLPEGIPEPADLKNYFKLKLKKSPTSDHPVLQDTISVFKSIQNIQKANGVQACHRFIISNCSSARSVLQVYSMANNLGMKAPISLDIVPLFETINDLENAHLIMEELFTLPSYKAHLKTRGNKHYIMLGFSDGTKDGGYFSANWNIFKAKQRMTEVARKYNIEAVFFDGRGGPPGRGGGNVRKYYASQGSKIENKEIQITIQGQTVSSRFSSVDAATFYLENLLTAGMECNLYSKETENREEEELLMQAISDASLEAYLTLKDKPDFISFLEHRSPLKYFGKTNIGSRPSKRGKSSQLTLSDLRAIPFVGSWSAMKLNIPGYYGLGFALKRIAEQYGKQVLIDLYHNNEFFESLISNSIQSLTKTRMELTRYFKDDATYAALWNDINNENNLTKEMITQLLDNETWESVLGTNDSIQLREEIVLPLLVIQQYALMEIEQAEQPNEVYEKLVMRSLYGIINAARNSA